MSSLGTNTRPTRRLTSCFADGSVTARSQTLERDARGCRYLTSAAVDKHRHALPHNEFCRWELVESLSEVAGRQNMLVANKVRTYGWDWLRGSLGFAGLLGSSYEECRLVLNQWKTRSFERVLRAIAPSKKATQSKQDNGIVWLGRCSCKGLQEFLCLFA